MTLKPALRPRFVLGFCVSWLLVLALGCVPEIGRAADEHWVRTWACGLQLTEPANLPPVPLANNTLRQFVHVTLGGKELRVRLSNEFGTNAVVVKEAHLALAAERGSAGTGSIESTTDTPLSFRGTSSVSVRAGEAVVSDPLAFRLPPLTNVAITIVFGGVSATTITGHPGSRTTSFIQSGNTAGAPSLPSAAKTAHWYMLSGIDVLAPDSAQALVVLGDSLTDGRGSTTDGNNRWPDLLALRLGTNPPAAGVAVLNMGIGGNGIYGGLGPCALARFQRDVLGQVGARWVLIFEGVNDIGAGASARSLTDAYSKFISYAHAQKLKAFGATITPFAGHSYYTPSHEAVRQQVNKWIRTSGQFDAVVDFDAAVRNPATLTKLLHAYDSGDGLHLNPAGYQAMANAVDPQLFSR